MTHCPCCPNHVDWFSRSCWQAMPAYNFSRYKALRSLKLVAEFWMKDEASLLTRIEEFNLGLATV